METLKIKPPLAHDVVLICVPGESLTAENIGYLEDANGKKYEILDQYTFYKTDPFPYGMMLLSTGQKITESVTWSAYKKSDKLIFFICRKMT